MRSPRFSVSSIPPLLAVLALPLFLVGCDSNTPQRDDPDFTTDNCTLPTSRLQQGCAGADCIPSIDGISPGADRLLDADETGSTWSVNGVAINGPRKGEQFDPVDVAYVSFWFAWAAFQPETDLWTNNSG